MDENHDADSRTGAWRLPEITDLTPVPAVTQPFSLHSLHLPQQPLTKTSGSTASS